MRSVGLDALLLKAVGLNLRLGSFIAPSCAFHPQQ
jgi:hypothetical protein